MARDLSPALFDALSADNEALKAAVVALTRTLPVQQQLRVLHGLARRAEGASDLDLVEPKLRVLWQVMPATARDMMTRLLDAGQG